MAAGSVDLQTGLAASQSGWKPPFELFVPISVATPVTSTLYENFRQIHAVSMAIFPWQVQDDSRVRSNKPSPVLQYLTRRDL